MDGLNFLTGLINKNASQIMSENGYYDQSYQEFIRVCAKTGISQEKTEILFQELKHLMHGNYIKGYQADKGK
jgi:hypothetical protein